MKVLHIETGKYLYGGALQVVYLMRGLQERGISNLLVCAKGSEIAGVVRDFADVHEIPMHIDLDPRFARDLRRVIRATAPDLVHVHSRRCADLWGGAVSWLCGVPALVTRRVDNPENAWLSRLKYAPYRRIITISEGIRSVLLAQKIAPEKLTCIHSSVDSEFFGRPGDCAWFRREFQFDEGHQVVAVIAQLIARKGHRYLLEKVRDIVNACPEARFLILGRGPLRDELEALCQQQGITEYVRFAGFRTDLPAILPCLDLVVHPATMEGLGVSLLQACAAGVPLVAARAGGIPEIIEHGVNGYLTDPGDGESLAGFIIELLCDRDKARSFGANGKRIIAEKFSIARMVEANAAVYQSIVNGS